VTHPSGRIERVADQWRVHDHVTGGLWVLDSEERALGMLKALERRDAAQDALARARTAVVKVMATAEEEEAVFTLIQLRKILLQLG